MPDYQFNGWELADFSQSGAAIAPTSVKSNSIQTPATIILSDCAEELTFRVDGGEISAMNQNSIGTGTVTLAKPVTIGDNTYATGAQVLPEASWKINAANGLILIVARLADGNSPDTHIVVCTTGLSPGQKLAVTDISASQNTSPGKNCFARGTLIETPHGALPIEQLEDGDEVMDRDGGVQLVSWVGRRRLSGLELVLNPTLRPIRISAGALTGGRPGQDLTVSQNHRLLVDDWRAPYLFGEEEILVPARSLLNNANVFVDCPLGGMDYYHLLMEGHELVCANGLWAETMVPDAETLAGFDDQQQTNILAGLRNSDQDFRTVIPALPYHYDNSVAA